MEARTMWRRMTAGGAVAAMVVALAATAARACMDYRPRPAGLVAQALSEDPAEAKAAQDKLRGMGPEGLGVLMYTYDFPRGRYPGFSPEALRAACSDEGGARNVAPGATENPALHRLRSGDEEALLRKRLAAAVDRVAGQKDAGACGLYWYTDLEAARAAARHEGKPILSLHLLGKLDEEFSCANSRFFRTVLYANAEVSAALRGRFVLHWQSERPVPKVTIDMGDGRVVERTVTGNSVHYVLDAEGRPVDAIPGLYGPKAFLRAIADAEGAVKETAKLSDDGVRQNYLVRWHAERAREAAAQLERDVKESRATEDGKWARIATLERHREDAALDAASRALVRAKNPDAVLAGRVAVTKARVEDPLARMLANLEWSIGMDTVRNEYELHRKVHEWFAAREYGTVARDVTGLNERVYAELFLTPRSDPWLGLLPPDAYSALEGGGVKLATK